MGEPRPLGAGGGRESMDSYGSDSRLPAAAAPLLDALWGRIAVLGDTPEVPPEELRAIAARVAAAGAAMRAEQLVMAVKRSWAGHSQLQRSVSRHGSLEILAQLVTLCIDAYYAPRSRMEGGWESRQYQERR